METQGMKHEKNQIDEYQKKGYTASYRFENGTLIDVDSKKRYGIEDVTIEEEYRYEGFTNPSDLSMLLILKMNDGSKGTMLVPYGPNADVELAGFIKTVSDKKNN